MSRGTARAVDLLSWFQWAIQMTTPEVPACCYRLNQEMNMSVPKRPKPDLPIHVQQAIIIAASVLHQCLLYLEGK